MSLLKKLGEGIKSTSKNIITNIQQHQEAMAKERNRREIYLRLKRDILKKLTLTDFKKICKCYLFYL